MPNIKVVNMSGAQVGEIALSDTVFGADVNEAVLHAAVRAYLLNQRQGTQSTLTRSEVSGGGRKPWKQKGTGNARAGFRQSPVWRGGGVAHGPKPRDYSQKINKKVMKLAFARAVSEKIAAGEILVVSEFKFEAAKTKAMVSFLKTIGVERSALVLTADFNETIALMVRNLPRVDSAMASELNPYAVLLFKNIVCDKAGFDALMARVAGKETK